MSVTQTFTVTVVSTGSGNKYFIDGVQQATVNLAEGYTYKFDQSDSSNSNHPLRLSTTSNGMHGGGGLVTTKWNTRSSGAYTHKSLSLLLLQLYIIIVLHWEWVVKQTLQLQMLGVF